LNEACFLMTDVVVECNRQACRVLDRSAEEILGRSPLAFRPEVQPDGELSLHKADRYLQRAAAGQPQQFDWRHELPDGRQIDLEVSLKSVAVGRRSMFLVVVRDVTQRRRAEAQLAFLSAIVESSQDAVIGKTVDGLITSWNAAAESLYGYSAAEALGRSVEMLVPAERAAELAPLLARVRSGRPVPGFKTVRRRKDGAWIDVSLSLSPIRDDQGRVIGISTLTRDFTERKRNDDTRRRVEAKFRAISDAALDAVVMADAEGRITHWNPAAERLFGYSEAEVLGRSVHQMLTPPEAQDQAGRALRDFMSVRWNSTAARLVELAARRSDGGTFPVELSLSAADIDGQRHAVAIIRDISQRRRAEEELRHYAQNLKLANQALECSNTLAEAATQAKSKFLANMSHEIRTPMTAILGFADVLLNQVQDADAREAVLTIRRNGEYLLALINDILDLSKVEAGRLEIARTPCLLQDLLADMLALMRPRAAAKNIALELICQGPLPATIVTDPVRLRQILVNLVGNAIKFTEFGSVQVVARLVTSAAPPLLEVAVVDTGIGMTAAQQARLFQPFSQADASTSRKFGGTGLGLAISQRLAHLLGGDIAVSSAAGEGSRFVLLTAVGDLSGVPLFAEALPQPAPAAPADRRSIDLQGLRILLVEDGPDNQRLITFLLRKAGAQVTLAENGRLAVEAVAAAKINALFDLVLMDVQMPEMDGYAATRLLRAMGYSQPIVALTAHAMVEDRQRCLDAGCNEYLSKPIERQCLLETIARLTAARGPCPAH